MTFVCSPRRLSSSLLLLLLLVALGPVRAQTQQLNFSASGLQGATLTNPTSLQHGPDGRLYVSQQDGTIKAFTVQRNGPQDYQVTGTETIGLIQTIPNHNDDGSPSTQSSRQVTGILVTGTSSNPILYVTSSDPRIGGGGGGSDLGLDTNSGVLTRLTCTGGVTNDTCAQWEMVHLVRGLPRSEENHSTNGLDLDPPTNTLYVMQGGHANKGAPSNNFSGTPEYYLSAALLSVDLDALNAMSVKTSDAGQNYLYDLPTLDDPTRANANGIDDPNAAGYTGVDDNDPFGGNNGLNQAITKAGEPVQVHSPGYRNAYDVVFTSQGRLYTFDNGPNGGWGGLPLIYDSNDNLKGHEGQNGVDFDAQAGNYCTNELNEDGSSGNPDVLKFVDQEGYYGGHPTPIRAFPGTADVIVYEKQNGTWTETARHNFLDLLPAGFSASDFPGNPVECDYTANDASNKLADVGASTNGITEYTASNFNGALQGNLLAASFDGTIYRYALNGTGDAVVTEEALFSGFGSNPLDVTAQGDGEAFAGTIWAATHGANDVTIFEPQDFGTCDTSDPLADADGDGYTNQDEDDNGTNPCNGGSQPDDADGDLVSDLNDADDDNDGTPDVSDPFPIDPDDGTTTDLPVERPFFNNDPGTGFFGLGFTGLMLPLDGQTDWLDLFDEQTLTAGGAAGLMTVEEVTVGDAFQNTNSQKNAFQFGVNVDANSDPFVVHTQLETPYFEVNGSPTTPDDFQSFGAFIGNGDQDHYLKIVFAANGGNGGVQVAVEDGGSFSGSMYGPGTVGNILSSNTVDLYLVVDPATSTVQPQVALNGGSRVDLGTPVSIPSAWLDPNDDRGLAVGLISTANGSNEPFGATWDFLTVETAPSAVRSFVQITPSGGINNSTFGSDSFTLENRSAGSTQITSVTFDASTAVLRDLVFDPNGNAGDATAKDFTVDTEGGTGQSTNSFSAPRDGGFDQLTVHFDDFDPGETFGFSVDMDPTTINGVSAPGPGESGSVSGLELTGMTVTVTYSDGTTHVVEPFRGPGTTQSGSENAVRSPAPPPPGIGVPSVALTPNGPYRTATVGTANQTVHVDGPVGATVRLLRLEAALFEPSGGGNDVDAFEANSITAVSEQTQTIGDPSGTDFTVSLSPTDANSGATATYNYLVAVVEDGSDGMTGPTSDVVALEYDPRTAPTVVARINAGGSQFTDANGDTWSADETFSGGQAFSNAVAIAGTDDDALYQTERFGDPFSYDIPVPRSGEYDVNLRFAEIFHGVENNNGAGSRVFSVDVENGQAGLTDYDLVADVGSATAVTKSFENVSVTDGTLNITFSLGPNGVDNAKISAIEVLQSSGTGGNQPPQISAIGNQTDTEGDQVSLSVSATDPDSGPQSLSYSATGLPAGLSIGSSSGTITGTVASGAAANSPHSVTVSVSDGADQTSESFTWTVSARPTAGDVLFRVNGGGTQLAASDASKPDWSPDTGSTPSSYLVQGGTETFSTSDAITLDASVPSGTPEALFQTERWDQPDAQDPEMQWEFPISSGTEVEIRLYLAEIFLTESGSNSNANKGPRVFDVAVDGTVPAAFNDLNLFSDVGHDVGVMKSFTTTSDGIIDLDFAHGQENPNVKGIEIVATGGANEPPAAPTAVSASAGNGTVDLSWAANGESDLDGYNVYRSTSSFSDPATATRVNGSLVTGTSFTDPGATNGTTYHYRLTAVDTGGNESGPSTTVTATPQSAPSVTVRGFRPVGAGLPGVERGAVDLGDLDGDGDRDVVLTGLDRRNHPSAFVYVNDGNGHFSALGADLTGVKNSDAAWIDVDGDGDDDLLLMGEKLGGGVVTRVYESTMSGGTRVLQEIANSGLPNLTDGSITVGRFANGDTVPDVLLTGVDDGGSRVSALFPGNGDGTFGTAVDRSGPAVANSAADVRRSTPPLAVLTGEQSDGTRVATVHEYGGAQTDLGTGVAFGSATWGSFVGDGQPDLVVTGANARGVPQATIYQNEGRSSGRWTFRPASVSLEGVTHSASTATDVDRDGDTDLVVTGENGSRVRTATVYRNDGGGTFTPITSGLTGVRFSDSAAGDLDGDGTPELVIVGERPSGAPLSRIYRGADSTCPAAWEVRLTVDIGGDGAASQTLRLGQASGATPGLDPTCGEDELPPSANIGTAFDARLVSIPGTNVDLGEGSLADVRPTDRVTGKAARAAEAVWKLKVNGNRSAGDLTINPQWHTGFAGVAGNNGEHDVTLEYVNSSGTQTVDLGTSVNPGATTVMNANVTTFTIRVSDRPEPTFDSPDPTVDTPGWTLLSVPYQLGDRTVQHFTQTLWTGPQACASAWTYVPGTGFVQVAGSDELTVGRGYLWNCPVPGSFDYSGGTEVTPKEVAVRAGWNVVAPFDEAIAASDVEILGGASRESPFFGFDPSTGFTPVRGDLQPTKGYWVKIGGRGRLEMDPATSASSGRSSATVARATTGGSPLAKATQLTITDEAGHRAALHLAATLPADVVERYELPPKMPGDVFDVRFARGTTVAPLSGGTAPTLELQGTRGTTTLEAQGLTTGEILHVTSQDDRITARLTADASSVQLPADVTALTVTARDAPATTRLAKSHPNPVSHRATIAFSLKQEADVTLEVYDLLGRRVATLVDASKPTGMHRTHLDASRLQSGVYFLRMHAGDVVKTQRLTVVR